MSKSKRGTDSLLNYYCCVVTLVEIQFMLFRILRANVTHLFQFIHVHRKTKLEQRKKERKRVRERERLLFLLLLLIVEIPIIVHH